MCAWLYICPLPQKSHIYWPFPSASLEQFHRAIWGVVSWATVFISPQIKFNLQLSHCAFFLGWHCLLAFLWNSRFSSFSFRWSSPLNILTIVVASIKSISMVVFHTLLPGSLFLTKKWLNFRAAQRKTISPNLLQATQTPLRGKTSWIPLLHQRFMMMLQNIVLADTSH